MRNKILPTLLLAAVMLMPVAFVKADDGVVITGNDAIPTPTPCISECPASAQAAGNSFGEGLTAAIVNATVAVVSLIP
jgi:hypothetical protein